jgi:hypothetical protein
MVESEIVQDFTADSSPDDTPRRAPPTGPDSDKGTSVRSPSFHANLENRWFDPSMHDERRSTPSPSPTEPAGLQTYVEMNTPQRASPQRPSPSPTKQNVGSARPSPAKQNVASPPNDALPAGSPGKPHHQRAQHAWGVDEVRALTPSAGRGDREGTPVPFGWEGNDNTALSLVDADLSLSPIEMQSSLIQVMEPSFESLNNSKFEHSDHSQSVETHHAFVPISIRSAVPEFQQVPPNAPPSPPKVVSLGALKKVV